MFDFKTRVGLKARIMLRKTPGLMPLTHFLMQNSMRPFSSGDLRLFRLLYCLEQTKTLPQDVAECGVGSGYGMAYALGYLNTQKDGRRYHAFDTFEGFPYIHPEDLEGLSEERKKVSVVGHYKDFAFSHIKRIVRAVHASERVTFHKGRFEETMPHLAEDQEFSFVFLDCDLYQSYLTCLENLYHRVVPGGIILFDEYECVEEWPGAKKAIDEFFTDKPEKPEPLSFGTSWMVRKQ